MLEPSGPRDVPVRSGLLRSGTRRDTPTPACNSSRCDRGSGRGPLRPSQAQTLWQCLKSSLMHPLPAGGLTDLGLHLVVNRRIVVITLDTI